MSKEIMQEAMENLGDGWEIKTDGNSEYFFCDFHDGYECKIFCCKDDKGEDKFLIFIYSSGDNGEKEPVKKDHEYYTFKLKSTVHNLHTAAKLVKPDKYEPSPDDHTEFVWGIKSFYDLTGNECSKDTMNDFDIIYDNEKNLYIMALETAFVFEKPEYAKDYTREVLKEFTQFMNDNGLDTNYELELYEVFTQDCSMHGGYESIEKLYAVFKMLVNGFCGQTHNENQTN